MYIFLRILLLFLWVLFVIFANDVFKLFIEYFKKKLEEFYQYSWQRRAGKFGRYFMIFYDGFLTKSYEIFGIVFTPVWWMVCFNIYMIILLFCHLCWVQIVFLVAEIFPQYLGELLEKPLRDLWF